MTTPATLDELLRLARRVWPGLHVSAVATRRYAAIEVDYSASHARLLAVEGVERAPEALHAALLVLAGEEGLRLLQAAGIPSADLSGYRQREPFSEDLH